MDIFKIFDVVSYDMECGMQPDLPKENREAGIKRISRNFDILSKYHLISDYHFNNNWISGQIKISFKCCNIFKKFVFRCLTTYKL